MLTRWAIALQSFDFTVRHKPGRLHVVPGLCPREFVSHRRRQYGHGLLSLTEAGAVAEFTLCQGLQVPFVICNEEKEIE